MAADLHKKSEVSPVIIWIDAHASILFLISIIILIALIIGLIVAIGTVFGASTGTEANVYYYQLESII